MSDIEWALKWTLRDGNDVATQCVCDAHLVKDVWIRACKISHHYRTSKDEAKDVLNDRWILPYAVSVLAAEASRDAGSVDG